MADVGGRGRKSMPPKQKENFTQYQEAMVWD